MCGVDIYAVALCVIVASVIFSVVILFRYPHLWLRSLALLTTSAALIMEPVLEAFNTSIWIFGRQQEGCGPSVFFVLLIVVGPFHLGFLLILIGSVIEERKHDPKKGQRTMCGVPCFRGLASTSLWPRGCRESMYALKRLMLSR